ncbi:MAG: hypothetical protein G01um101448_1145 [Parcubacteria group bacterium Gr01-1014_48]|nr:MAG: hypothetical protein G01um101448_1145 [Parcubacteria group bacterium Gr01-1014_48]
MDKRLFGQFRNAVILARKKAGKTQFELASDCGITSRTISSIETGKTKNLRIDTIARIAMVLRLNPNQYLYPEQLSSEALEKLRQQLPIGNWLKPFKL